MIRPTPKYLAAAFLAWGTLAPPLPAQAPFSAIEAKLEAKFSGVIVATRQGKLVYQRAFGAAQADSGEVNDIGKRFRIGSISKTFTAALARKMESEGLLSLNDSLSKHIPSFPNGDAIKLTDLLHHRSGLADFSQADWKALWLPTAPLSQERIVAMIAAKKAKSVPGTKFAYNNVGYVLMGVVLERVSKRPYPELLREKITVPLGMVDTGWFQTDREVMNLSAGHGPKRTLDPAQYDYTAIIAAGGLYSTASDLVRWCNAHVETGSLATWQSGERFGRKVSWHAGNTNSYSSLIVRFPEIEGCYIVLSNIGRTNPPVEIMRSLPNALFRR